MKQFTLDLFKTLTELPGAPGFEHDVRSFMKKEVSRRKDSTVFEGMTSISAVLNGGYRRIERILIDSEKAPSKRRQIDFLTHRSREMGFDIEYTDADTLEEMTTGTSH